MMLQIACNLVILVEINCVLFFELLSIKEIIELVNNEAENAEFTYIEIGT